MSIRKNQNAPLLDADALVPGKEYYQGNGDKVIFVAKAPEGGDPADALIFMKAGKVVTRYIDGRFKQGWAGNEMDVHGDLNGAKLYINVYTSGKVEVFYTHEEALEHQHTMGHGDAIVLAQEFTIDGDKLNDDHY